MKLRIDRVYDPLSNEFNFFLYADDKFILSRNFKENEPEKSIYNETKNLDEVKEIIKRIEKAGSIEKVIEVVYESK